MGSRRCEGYLQRFVGVIRSELEERWSKINEEGEWRFCHDTEESFVRMRSPER